MSLLWGMSRPPAKTNISSLDQQEDSLQDTQESREFGPSELNLLIYLVDRCTGSFLSGMGSTLDKNDSCRAKITYNYISLKNTLNLNSSGCEETITSSLSQSTEQKVSSWINSLNWPTGTIQSISGNIHQLYVRCMSESCPFALIFSLTLPSGTGQS